MKTQELSRSIMDVIQEAQKELDKKSLILFLADTVRMLSTITVMAVTTGGK